MKICFLTLGTRGDVQPYLALAKELRCRGHRAVIATGQSFQQMIEAEGVEFYPTSLDLMALAQTPEGKALLEAPLQHLVSAWKMSKEVLNPAYRATMDDFYQAAQEADLIIYHPKALGAVDIAVKLAIPAISMPPTPTTYPISNFPCLALSARHNFGSWLNRKSYAVNRKGEAGQIKQINAFRKETLDLPPRKVGDYTYVRDGQEIPLVYPISPYLFKDVEDWTGHVELPGFFFLETSENLSPDLEAFLQAGSKPLVVTFSSMSLKSPEIFMENLQAAVDEAGLRAVILLGNHQLELEQRDNVFLAQQAPHSLLFERAWAVLHHGGAGTTAAALKAGIPQIIMPHSLDQPFWARRVYEAGCGLEPLAAAGLGKDDLLASFAGLKDETLLKQVQLLGQQIEAEKGLETAADWLESYYLL